MISATKKMDKDQVEPDPDVKQDSKTAVHQSSTDKTHLDYPINRKPNDPPLTNPLTKQSSADNDLLLKFTTSNAIIHHLISIPTYLFGPPVSEDAKERLFKESNELMMNLASLPLLDEKNSLSDQESPLVLEITWEFKSKMVACLTSNLSYAAFYRDSMSIEAKKKLMEENKQIINHLLSLPIGAEAKDDLTRKRNSNDNQENKAFEGNHTVGSVLTLNLIRFLLLSTLDL